MAKNDSAAKRLGCEAARLRGREGKSRQQACPRLKSQLAERGP